MIAAQPIVTLGSLGLPVERGAEDYVNRVINQELDGPGFEHLLTYGKALTVTDEFRKVIDYFKVEPGHTKIKVSGVPRTFTLAAALFLFEHYDVKLIGTRSAGKLIDQYAAYIAKASL